LAIHVLLRKHEDTPESVTYRFGFADEDSLTGVIRLNKLTGDIETLKSDYPAARERAERLLRLCYQEGEYPDEVEYRH
jgi:hypothetical protein